MYAYINLLLMTLIIALMFCCFSSEISFLTFISSEKSEELQICNNEK